MRKEKRGEIVPSFEGERGVWGWAPQPKKPAPPPPPAHLVKSPPPTPPPRRHTHKNFVFVRGEKFISSLFNIGNVCVRWKGMNMPLWGTEAEYEDGLRNGTFLCKGKVLLFTGFVFVLPPKLKKVVLVQCLFLSWEMIFSLRRN